MDDDSEMVTRYMVVREGGNMHDVFDDEDAAIGEAASHDPSWGVFPVYYPPTRVDEPEDIPAKKAPARRPSVKKDENG